MTDFPDDKIDPEVDSQGSAEQPDDLVEESQPAEISQQSLSESVEEEFDDEAELLGDDLELAYQRALETNEAIEWAIGTGEGESAEEEGVVEESTANSSESDDSVEAEGESQPANSETDASAEEQVSTDSTVQTDVEDSSEEETESRVQPEQVIEAALFVGDKPLTTKKLNNLLRGDDTHGVAEEMVDKLNLQYAEEQRPYEIRLGEGGYRMILRPEFDRVRNKVFGLGPKDVKLSQDVLEVLALVAYKQPVSKKQIEELGKENPGGPLGQLLRRELIAIQRGENKRKDVKYVTTARFLSLFGLAELDELPQANELELK